MEGGFQDSHWPSLFPDVNLLGGCLGKKIKVVEAVTDAIGLPT